jgi:hypothetical protein
MHKPTSTHLAALKRLLRYLVGTIDRGLFLHKDSSLNLHAFTDADWAGDIDDYISTKGFIIYAGKNPLCWGSNKQRTIARSSAEVEYRALASTTTELLWLVNLFTELGIQSPSTPTV